MCTNVCVTYVNLANDCATYMYVNTAKKGYKRFIRHRLGYSYNILHVLWRFWASDDFGRLTRIVHVRRWMEYDSKEIEGLLGKIEEKASV